MSVDPNLARVKRTARGLKMWYFSFPAATTLHRRSIAMAQIRRATRPITVYSGSMPFEKKKLRLAAVDIHAA